MSTCQLCHTVKWQTNKNEVITEIIKFSSLPHCQHVTVCVDIFNNIYIYISCCVQIMSKFHEIPKCYVGLCNVVCAALYVVGKHSLMSYRENIGCGCLTA